MPVVAARAFYLLIGLAIVAGSLAYGRLATERGYFKGRGGRLYHRGEASYTGHLFLLGVGILGGTAIAGAGLLAPADSRIFKNP